MFGYIRPSKPHLSEQDEARFQSVYCGLCHELGRKYGFAARFVLNFDVTFLAILLSDAQEPECESCRCAAHPCKAQCVMAHTVALETAADHSLVLAWWQLRDHIEDHGFFKAIPYRLAALLLRGAYRKASAYALLSCGVWTSILDSIFYESLYGIGSAVLKGTYHKPPRRIHFRIKAEKNEETV